MSLWVLTPLLWALPAAAPPTVADRLVEPASEIAFDARPLIDGERFVCLGAGIRKKSIFKVYAVSFCLEKAGAAQLEAWLARSGQRLAGRAGLADALADDEAFFRELLSLGVAKAVEMAFVRDVSRDKIRAAFADSLVRVLGEGERGRVEAFVAQLQREVRSGERLTLLARPGGDITVWLSGERRVLHDEIIAGALWTPYLGTDSITPSLKRSVAQGVARLHLQARSAGWSAESAH